jgi:hypothetical protein
VRERNPILASEAVLQRWAELGSPDQVRVRVEACEIDVLVDVLRDVRTKATRDAADTYATTPRRDRSTTASTPWKSCSSSSRSSRQTGPARRSLLRR